MRISFILAAALVAGCATTSSPAILLDYAFLDLPERQGFEVSYTNSSKRSVCVDPGQWPNEGGWIHFGQDYMSLSVGSQRFAMKPFNTGYCPRCATKVKPGKTLTSFVPYDHFGLPSTMQSAPKKLDFRPHAFPCSSL